MTLSDQHLAVPTPPLVLLTLGRVGLYPPAALTGALFPEGGTRLVYGHSSGMPASAPTPILAPGKPLALLTYLALSPGRSASREYLLDLLWADTDGDRGRHALRQTLWQLRQLLGEGALQGREEIQLALGIECDRDHFLAAVESGDLVRAVTLYTGHFLPGFAAPGGAEFEQWADRERDRLRSLMVRSADTLARRSLARGQPREAVRLARQIREAEPFFEGGWRLLLEALSAANDRVQLLVESDALEELLRVEGREPEPATRAALRAARQTGEPAPPQQGTTTLVAELVGREAEFRIMTQAWEQARVGPAAHVHLIAPAGLGKTRLLQDFHARLKALGARAIMARANPGERDLPFALAADLAGALGELPGAGAVSPGTAATLVALNPALGSQFRAVDPTVPSADQLLQRSIALAELLTAVAYEAPVAILVDDLHWADASSLRLFQAVQSRLGRARVLLITTTRPNRNHDRPMTDTTVLPLAPLSLGEVDTLVTSLGRPPLGPEGEFLVTTLWRTSGGSPLQVLEGLRQALDNEYLALERDGWKIRDLDLLGRTLAQGGSTLGRLATLDSAARYQLTLLAVAGAPCSTELLGRAATRDGEGNAIALATLERRGFITEVRGEWVPVHDEIAAAALDLSDPASQKAAARSLGEALVASGPCDDQTLRRALQLFLQAGADDRIAPALVAQRPARWRVRSAESRRAALAELTGLKPDDARFQGVLEALPRAPRWYPQAAAILVVGALWAGWVVSRAGAEPDATLVVLSANGPDPDGRPGVTRTVPIRAADWVAGTPLRPDRKRGEFRDHIPVSPMALLPDGAVIFSKFVSNRNTDDIFMARPGEAPALLIGGPRDEGLPAVSPDARLMAFLTARWSPEGADDYDIGLLDLQDRSLRQLTHGEDFDQRMAWSPSGALIAFVRTPRALRPPEVCWIPTAPGPTEPFCRTAPNEQSATVLGFQDHHTVLLLSARGDHNVFVRWHLAQDRLEEFWAMAVVRSVSASPDGQWIACQCATLPDRPPSWQVFPVASPSSARPLGIDSVSALAWLPRGPGDPSVLELQEEEPLAVGTSTMLTVTLRDGNGDPIWLPRSAIAWSVGDSSVALIDQGGRRLRALQVGQTVVGARVGPRIHAAITVAVTSDTAQVVLREPWERLDPARWRAVGEPGPRVIRHPDGTRGFNNGGDGVYASGVFSVDAWPLRGGLGLEAPVYTQLSRSQWQIQHLIIESTRRTLVDQWDLVSGAPPIDERFVPELCAFYVPNGEGFAATKSVAFSVGSAPTRAVPADSTWRTGAWHRIRVQVFADGSCGLAIDGVPITRSEPVLPRNLSYRLWLMGNSADTDRLLVGPLTVWQGVRTDIDWSPLDTIP